jgi:P-type E1-E2 ATPase
MTIVAELKRQGIVVWMCTGDNMRTARVMAKQLGIDAHQVEVIIAICPINPHL